MTEQVNNSKYLDLLGYGEGLPRIVYDLDKYGGEDSNTRSDLGTVYCEVLRILIAENCLIFRPKVTQLIAQMSFNYETDVASWRSVT